MADEEMNMCEALMEKTEESVIRKILEIMEKSNDLTEAKEKVRMLLKN